MDVYEEVGKRVGTAIRYGIQRFTVVRITKCINYKAVVAIIGDAFLRVSYQQ